MRPCLCLLVTADCWLAAPRLPSASAIDGAFSHFSLNSLLAYLLTSCVPYSLVLAYLLDCFVTASLRFVASLLTRAALSLHGQRLIKRVTSTSPVAVCTSPAEAHLRLTALPESAWILRVMAHATVAPCVAAAVVAASVAAGVEAA